MSTKNATCQIHLSNYNHHPVSACALEWHHLMSRDWQRSLLAAGDPTTFAPGVVFPGDQPKIVQDQTYGSVWEPAGVYATRTCHGNVHIGIVALVHAWQPGDDITQTIKRARRSLTSSALDAQTWIAAAKALELWTEHGQDIAFLQAHHLWGNL